MALFEDAHASVIIAEHITIEATGKMYALGVGFQVAGVGPNGLTSPLCVAALIDVPRKYAGSQTSVSLELRDDTSGNVATFPGPGGTSQALRVQQLVMFNAPQIPGLYNPEEVPCRTQTLLAFSK